MSEQNAKFTRDYNEGRKDGLSGEVKMEWSDYWTDGYREGVTDALMSLSLV